MSIIVNGTGGIGNSLFQIATAIYYAEEYNYKIVLKKTNALIYGGSNSFIKLHGKTYDRIYKDLKTGIVKTYKDTIYKNFYFDIDDEIQKSGQLTNNYTDIKVVPFGQNIEIAGYSQNLNLFYKHIDKIPKYLCLNDENIINYIRNKYKNIENSICIGIRVGEDYTHMKKISSKSYSNALNYCKNNGINTKDIYILSDVKNSWEDIFKLNNDYPAIDVDEADIVQFYLGLMCKNYILSESTFHLWIAYLGTINESEKKVICFNDTDITNRNLNLPNWITIDY